MTTDSVSLADSLLDAAAENTARAQVSGVRTDIAPEDAALTAKNYASAALSQIQAHLSLVGRGRR